MRCGYLILLFSFLAQISYSQLYTFEKVEEEYQPLENGIQISGSEAWTDTIYHIPIGFDFIIYGKKFDSFYLQQGNLFFNRYLDNNESYDTAYFFFTSQFNIFDSGNDTLGSLSPIKFETSGVPGSQIFVIEYNNATVETDFGLYFHIDFQVRLYEYNGTLEFHYGPTDYDSEKEILQYLGVNMVTFNEQDSVIVIRQTRLGGRANIFFIDDSNPWIGVRITPEENDVYCFLYDRDIILNNYVDYTLISELGNYYNLSCNGEIIYSEGNSLGAEIGHNILKDYEWAERFIIYDSVVLKGFVSQNYGYINNNNDSVYYSIYLPGSDLLPGKSILTRKISFHDLDLSGNLNVFGIDKPFIIKDTFFITFGVPPYEDYSDNCIGIYYTYADPYNPINYDYGRTAARWMDGNWYDIFTSRYINPYTPKLPYLSHTDDLIHFSIAPLVNFCTKNLTPIEDHIKATEPPVGIKRSIEYENIKLYPPYPNPAENSVIICFEIKETIPVKLSVYKMNGAMVHNTRLDCIAYQPVNYNMDISTWETGEYICLLQAGAKQISFVITKL
jgi:hypothetical protein